MKKLSFAAGMLTMALIGGLGVTALAATGQMTITVDPVNIQVNGQTFQPKDANGADVPVFAYNGTTYAPLRALAKAYGLTVGYDQEANMATVGETAPAPDTTATTYSDWTDEEEAAYQEFKGMWDFKYVGVDTSLGQERDTYDALPSSNSMNAVEIYEGTPQKVLDLYAERLLHELKGEIGVIVAFCNTDGSWTGYGVSLFEDGSLWLGHN